MATILAHIRIKKGHEAEFEAIAHDLFTASHAEEKKLKRYEYWRGQEEGHYYTLLAFEDFNGFLTHQSSDPHEIASPKLRPIMESIRLEWLDPVQGASPLPPTAPQAVDPNASDLAKTYGEKYPPAMAAWWARVGKDA